jgi:hypothetical protein
LNTFGSAALSCGRPTEALISAAAETNTGGNMRPRRQKPKPVDTLRAPSLPNVTDEPRRCLARLVALHEA